MTGKFKMFLEQIATADNQKKYNRIKDLRLQQNKLRERLATLNLEYEQNKEQIKDGLCLDFQLEYFVNKLQDSLKKTCH